MCTRPTEVFNDRKRGGKHSKEKKGRKEEKHSRGINISLRGSKHANLIQPNLRPHQLGIAQIRTRVERDRAEVFSSHRNTRQQATQRNYILDI